jgi:hypothetical protein
LSRKYYTVGCGVVENAVKDFNKEDLDLVNYFCLPELGDRTPLQIAA